MTSRKGSGSETDSPGWRPRPWLFDKVAARHGKAVILACVGILVQTVIQNVYLLKAMLVQATWEHATALAIASLLFLPLGYGMSAFSLGMQVRNPQCSRRVLDFFCKTGFWFFGIGSLLSVPGTFLVAPDNFPNLATPAALGAAWAAYATHKKHVTGDSEKRSA